VKEEMSERNLLYSGLYGQRLREVRDEYARRWRDRKRAGDRRIAELQEAEGGSVKLWRKVKGLPWPDSPDVEELRVITAAWEDEDLRREAVEREITSIQ
jgi:hypothetical protein